MLLLAAGACILLCTMRCLKAMIVFWLYMPCVRLLLRYKTHQQHSSAAANGTAANGAAAGPLPVLASACPGERALVFAVSMIEKQQC
jgi:hypothetical protein